MNIIDIILIVLISAAVIRGIIVTMKRKEKGSACCGDCSKCGECRK